MASAASGASTAGTPAPQAQGSQSDAGLFQIGTSVVNISPNKPMADGGYGSDYIVTGGVHDPLEVRAFFIGHGKQAVVFVTVDSQGWFAEYQSPNVGDGGDDARADAAAALAAQGYEVTASNIVLSSTHTHAAPTLMGLWGHTDPGYLHRVKEAAVRAVIKAASHTHEAELWSATGTIHGLVSQLQGTDQTAGYLGRRSAADPVGAPARHRRDDRHVRRRAGPRRRIRPDRRRQQPVERRLPRVGPESSRPVARRHRRGSGRHARQAGDDRLQRSLLRGRRAGPFHHKCDSSARSPTRARSPTPRWRPTTCRSRPKPRTWVCWRRCRATIPVGRSVVPARSASPRATTAEGTWNWEEVGGIFTINRSLEAPYFNVNGEEEFTVGSSATVARIGDQVYATVPGEGFPEVTEAIERAFAARPASGRACRR